MDFCIRFSSSRHDGVGCTITRQIYGGLQDQDSGSSAFATPHLEDHSLKVSVRYFFGQPKLLYFPKGWSCTNITFNALFQDGHQFSQGSEDDVAFLFPPSPLIERVAHVSVKTVLCGHVIGDMHLLHPFCSPMGKHTVFTRCHYVDQAASTDKPFPPTEKTRSSYHLSPVLGEGRKTLDRSI